MSCCDICMEVNLGWKTPDQAQGHYLCSVPTQAELAAYVAGEHPLLHNNRWSIVSATPVFEKDGEQVWRLDERHFIVDWENGEVIENPV